MTFFGEFRGGSKSDPEIEDSSEVHIVESPNTMILPMIILSFMAVLGGFLVNPLIDLGIIPVHWLTEFLEHGPVHVEIHGLNISIAILSTILSITGILIGYSLFNGSAQSRSFLGKSLDNSMFRALNSLLRNKYYFDQFYENVLVFKILYSPLIF